MQRKPPAIIKKVGFAFRWEESKVWKLNYPTKEISVQELSWHFKIPFWSTKHGYYDLSPEEVVKNPKKHAKEFARIMQSDLKYPLDIMKNKGRWLMLDGLHRLVKAHVLGMHIVRVRKIPRKEIKNIRI
jgi:hypothetical protein